MITGGNNLSSVPNQNQQSDRNRSHVPQAVHAVVRASHTDLQLVRVFEFRRTHHDIGIVGPRMFLIDDCVVRGGTINFQECLKGITPGKVLDVCLKVKVRNSKPWMELEATLMSCDVI